MLRRRIARLALRAVRWKAVGEVPERGVLVGAPHTSNWDWVLTLLLGWTYGIDIKLLVKQELFVGPLGWLLRRTGAVELDRKNPSATIKKMLAESAGDDPWLIGIAAEGTRSKRRVLEVRLLPDRPADRPADHARLPRRAVAHRRLGSDLPPDRRREGRHGRAPRVLRRQDRLQPRGLHAAAAARGGVRPALRWGVPRLPAPLARGLGCRASTEGSMSWLCCCGSLPSSSWCPASSRWSEASFVMGIVLIIVGLLVGPGGVSLFTK